MTVITIPAASVTLSTLCGGRGQRERVHSYRYGWLGTRVSKYYREKHTTEVLDLLLEEVERSIHRAIILVLLSKNLPPFQTVKLLFITQNPLQRLLFIQTF